MPLTKNATLVLAVIPPSHSRIDPNVHVKVVDRPIDLENAPLNGGTLVKTLALSSDPYIVYRLRDPSVEMFCPVVALNDPVDNSGIGKVIRSDDPSLKPGDIVQGYLDFSEYSIYPVKQPHWLKMPLVKLDPSLDIPLTTYLGALGLPGHTAYSAYKTFIAEKAKTAKTMFVSSGAGAVGTFIIEYTKLLAPHIKIIASAGTPGKVQHMKEIGVDVPFNYNAEDTDKVLKEHGPLDIYFDSVGGSTLDTALMNFNQAGLIVACGCISSAAGTSSVKNFDQIFLRSLTVKGFITYTHECAPAFATFYSDVVPLYKQGKITNHEHRFHGIVGAGEALLSVHTGTNKGKAVIWLADD